jgi:hypothetical protein
MNQYRWGKHTLSHDFTWCTLEPTGKRRRRAKRVPEQLEKAVRDICAGDVVSDVTVPASYLWTWLNRLVFEVADPQKVLGAIYDRLLLREVCGRALDSRAGSIRIRSLKCAYVHANTPVAYRCLCLQRGDVTAVIGGMHPKKVKPGTDPFPVAA